MQDGTKREVVSGSSLLDSFGVSFWFERFGLQHAAKECMQQNQTYNKQLTKMVPKWSQNLSKIDPGGGLEATWEPPLKQGASKTSFLMILAPFWDPLWDQFGLILGIMFLMFFWSAFLRALASIWAPKTSKMKPKRGSKPKPENHRFCCYLLHFGYIQGCWKL